MNIKINQQQLNDICIENDIGFLGLFGSCARETQNPKSDIDLLVNFKKTKSLLEKGDIITKFQALFKREVDLVSAKNLKPTIRPYVMKDLVTLYEE